MAFVSHANTPVQRCVAFLLQNTTQLQATPGQNTDLDANNDGIINMDDLAMLINQEAMENEIIRLIAGQENSPEVQAIVNELLNGNSQRFTINDLAKAINKQQKKKDNTK